MSTAQTLGEYRKGLEAAGFTREEAMGLVGHVAPMDMDDLNVTPLTDASELPKIFVLAGSQGEGALWIVRQVRQGTAARFTVVAGDPSALRGLPGPVPVVTLPGFYRLPVELRAEIKAVIRHANATA